MPSRRNPTRRPREYPPEKKAEVLAVLAELNGSTAAAAKATGFNRTTIALWAKEAAAVAAANAPIDAILSAPTPPLPTSMPQTLPPGQGHVFEGSGVNDGGLLAEQALAAALAAAGEGGRPDIDAIAAKARARVAREKADVARLLGKAAIKFVRVAIRKADDCTAKEAMAAAGIAIDKLTLLREGQPQQPAPQVNVDVAVRLAPYARAIAIFAAGAGDGPPRRVHPEQLVHPSDAAQQADAVPPLP